MKEYISIIIAALALMGTILTLVANKGKLSAETEKIRIEILNDLQEQLNILMDNNKKLFVEREIQREEKEKLRTELNRLHDGMDILRRESQTERERSTFLAKDLENQRASNTEKTTKIEELQTQITKLTGEVTGIKRVTGQLRLSP